MQVTGAALCEDREMLMRRLLPEPCADVDPRDVYRLEDRTTAHLRVNMVASVDGAAAVEGRVGALSGQADQVLLHDLRVLCDVLLVGPVRSAPRGTGRSRCPPRTSVCAWRRVGSRCHGWRS